jgi:hypothetical protein
MMDSSAISKWFKISIQILKRFYQMIITKIYKTLPQKPLILSKINRSKI